jgi:SAM-dependent methyltransferase
MPEIPNANASTNDFEFEALSEARNYRHALFEQFGPYLKGDVAEIGAGIGQMTELLRARPGVKQAVAVEPDAQYCAKHRALHPNHEVVNGTAADLPAGKPWDAILSINVLEHIGDDQGELKRYAGMLRERKGALCLFVPAGPGIYAPIDKDFGHFRRYTKAELGRKLKDAGFKIERLDYFNWVGFFAWWMNFKVLKKRGFEAGKVRMFDRAIFPWVYRMENVIMRPPFGQSLMAVGRAG